MVDEALVGLEQPTPGDEVGVVQVVKHLRREPVECLGYGALRDILGALGLQHLGELGADGRVGVDDRREAVGEGGAVGDADGVRTCCTSGSI